MQSAGEPKRRRRGSRRRHSRWRRETELRERRGRGASWRRIQAASASSSAVGTQAAQELSQRRRGRVDRQRERRGAVRLHRAPPNLRPRLAPPSIPPLPPPPPSCRELEDVLARKLEVAFRRLAALQPPPPPLRCRRLRHAAAASLTLPRRAPPAAPPRPPTLAARLRLRRPVSAGPPPLPSTVPPLAPPRPTDALADTMPCRQDGGSSACAYPLEPEGNEREREEKIRNEWWEDKMHGGGRR